MGKNDQEIVFNDFGYISFKKGPKMIKKHYSSKTPWEPVVGYSRAIRVGPVVKVSGTTATDEDGNVVAIGDAYGQTIRIIQNIEIALKGVGAELTDVIRTRIYVTDIDRWEDVGRAHGKYFGAIHPATSMIEVSRLIHPDMLVEIEAEAYLNEEKE